MDKPPPAVIYKDVKDTIAGNSQDLLELVNEKIYYQFSSLFSKHPVIMVNNKVPVDVLKWYETYVFKQPESICESRPDVIEKEPESFKNGDSINISTGSTTIIEMVPENPEPQPVDTQKEVNNSLNPNQDSVAMDIADLLPSSELTGPTEPSEQAHVDDKQAHVEDKQAEVSKGCEDLELMQEVKNASKDYAMTQELPTITEDILNSFLYELTPVEVCRNEVEAKHSEPVSPVNIVQKSQHIDTEATIKAPEIKKTVTKTDNSSVLSTIDDENNILDFDL